MKCKHAILNGTPVLVNFRTNDGMVSMLIQDMDKPIRYEWVNSLHISDYDPGTAILNGEDVLQMEPSDLAYVYARFAIVKR